MGRRGTWPIVDLRLRSILLGFALLSITAAFSENILPCGGWFNASASNLCWGALFVSTQCKIRMSNTAVTAPMRLVSIVVKVANRANKGSFVTESSGFARPLTSLNTGYVNR